MKKYVVYVSMGYVGCKDTVEIEVEDDTPEDEIEGIAREVMFSMIEWGYVPADKHKGLVDR